ncbi:hypothetical protein [Costertonia aggregata]|uniref:Uncharacterized protein n=1 Tax=Costertonia aggregata TaxID=343403 RepID=A0A7H9AK06_9FLAO|nr:hypothetical protein [Costertonia aggregata]QLG43879.1 hypothetical protein HYG79_00435 [Costertonia aggregata]
MEELPILNITGGILFYIGKIIILIAVIIALYKMKNLGSILLFLGAVSMIISDIAGFILVYYAGTVSPEQIVKATSMNSIISAITYILFAVGLLLFIVKSTKRVST